MTEVPPEDTPATRSGLEALKSLLVIGEHNIDFVPWVQQARKFVETMYDKELPRFDLTNEYAVGKEAALLLLLRRRVTFYRVFDGQNGGVPYAVGVQAVLKHDAANSVTFHRWCREL